MLVINNSADFCHNVSKINLLSVSKMSSAAGILLTRLSVTACANNGTPGLSPVNLDRHFFFLFLYRERAPFFLIAKLKEDAGPMPNSANILSED